jgi:diguanylate cyclase (GGDEF)-like protein
VSNKAKIIELLAWLTLLLGVVAFGHAVGSFPVDRIDAGLLALTAATIFFGSFLQLQLPRTKIYFTISDTLIFIAFLTYGGETAIILATLESLFSSLNFKRKGINIKARTLFLNSTIATVTTWVTVHLAAYLFVSVHETAEKARLSDFVSLLCVMAFSQFLLNSIAVSVFMIGKAGKSFRQIWYENCFNTLVMYCAGALIAGLVFKAFIGIEPALLIAAGSFAAIVYLTYRHYLNEITTTSAKAEKAERERAEEAESHIEELRHYIEEQERTSRALRESRERFRHAAFHDPLTDLPNRNLFIETLKFLLQQVKSSPQKKFAVLFLDLNRFKTINDSLGHSAGDRLIMHVGKRLSALIRGGDLVARFSGDEFAVILHDVSTVDDAIQFAEQIRRKIVAPFTITGRQVFTSVSIGIALSHEGYEEAEDILRDADIAMYHAKDRDREYMVFDQTMHARAVTLLQLETDLRHAVEREEMLVFYQPIIDLATMRLMGFEALMRWNHPQRGLVPPSEFIPVSEENGLIVPLTLWILRESCRQLVAWQRLSPLNKSLMMSINLSGKHFAHADLVEQIRRIIAETGANPLNLKLEITESAVMENAENAIQLLKNLRALGVQLSIDDFGTGYSSLSYLHRFPIDMLKVDRSFVGTMEDGTENGEIVRTIISLAKTLDLNVIAEGIETIHQLHQLRILGCEYGQGYLFSRPVPAHEAEAILEDKTRWQRIIPDNNPAVVPQNREFTHLRLAK